MFAIFFGLRAYHCLFMKDIYFCGFVGLYGMRTNIIKKGVKERLKVEGGMWQLIFFHFRSLIIFVAVSFLLLFFFKG
jgi:hypothetical protein